MCVYVRVCVCVPVFRRARKAREACDMKESDSECEQMEGR